MIRRILVLGALLVVVSASANVAAGDTALAEALFQQGRQLMDQHDYRAALPKLAESYAQDPATGSLLALAICEEQLGLTASAWANYSEVVSRAKREGREDRALAARERMQALEPLLSRLTIVVDTLLAGTSELLVRRDGSPIGPAAWGYAAPIDPGEHVIEASAPGKVPWKTTITVGATADAKTVMVPGLADAEALPSTPMVGASGASPGDTSSEGPSRRSTTLRTSGIAVGGAGIAVLGVSAYFGLHATALKHDANCDDDNVCDESGVAKTKSAVTSARNATITLITGSVLAAAGITLFLVGNSPRAAGPQRDAKPGLTRLEAAPAIGPTTAALVVRGAF
jgi:hypothetical protein